MDDLLDSDLGKHDYDWLLTPPGTPHAPILDVVEKPPSSAVPKRSTARSSSTTRASRLSSTQLENDYSARPTRSSSVSRSAIQSSFITGSNRTSILNTSMASVTSRPSTPTKRPGTLTSAKPSVANSSPLPTRSPTPVKARPSSAAGTKTAPSQNSRPSTPTSRARIAPTSASSLNSSAARSSSRSSTPTRQPIVPASAPASGRSPSVGRTPTSNSLTSGGRNFATNGRSSAPSSRASSPSPRPRAPVQPLDIPDFPTETPPNLRTRLPERPTSAGRVRPGMSLTMRATPNSETAAPPSSSKKSPLPAVSRSKFSDVPSKVSLLSNGQQSKQSEIQKPRILETEAKKSIKSPTATDSTGFGRTISKKSLDMAIRHMDIRQNLGGIRGASLFPHSIRSVSTKGRPARLSDPTARFPKDNRLFSENGNRTPCLDATSNNDDSTANYSPDRESLAVKETLSELDIYASSRYDAMLLREDTKNTDWLHSLDDKSNESPVFDHRFEPLPEPFGPL